MLPYDLVLTTLYCADKPLNELVRSNDFYHLKLRLENGEDPNYIDMRYNGYGICYTRSPCLPIMEAFKHGHIKLFSTLIDHGAVVPIEFFCSINHDDVVFLKLALSKGVGQCITQSIAAQYIVSEIITRGLKKGEPEDVDALYSSVKLLLDNGFPLNGQELFQSNFSRYGVSSYRWMENPIDCIQNSKYLASETKKRFIELLRSHGAKSSSELEILHAVSLPQTTPYDQIPEMFIPVAKLFANNPCCRFSSSYSGIDVPVLVIDYGSKTEKGYIYRENVIVHHRETPTRWSQNGTPFDIPVSFRVVLTPKGVRIPSRIYGDMPTKDIILEDWLTLPACEAYIERAIVPTYSTTALNKLAVLCETECESSRRLKALPSRFFGIQQTPYRLEADQNGRSNILGRKNVEHHPLSLSFKTYQDYRRTQGIKGYYSYNYLHDERKLNALGKASGIKGNWFGKTFSSHRNLNLLSASCDHRVPFPDEFLVMVDSVRYSELIEGSDKCIDYKDSHKGQYYWNCRAYKFKGCHKGAFIYVLYGDEASPEQFEQVVEIAKKVFVK